MAKTGRPRNPNAEVQLPLRLANATAEAILQYQHNANIATQSEAVRTIIAAGMTALQIPVGTKQ